MLTIAGSDSGGGAGIQADLKAITAQGGFGTTAITCITAQNPGQVAGVEPVLAEMVSRQIDTVADFFNIAAAKTGMLYSSEIVRAVVEALDRCAIPHVVVDPVMVATSGARLLQDEAVAAVKNDLIRRATVITPNRPEAEVLCDDAIADMVSAESACRAIAERYDVACVLTGGHFEDSGQGSITDLLFCEGQLHRFPGPLVEDVDSHGTGCAFSASLATQLAHGARVPDAVRAAKYYVVELLRRRRSMAMGGGPFE